MYRSGTFVAEHVTPTTEAQVQPNGVDLTLEAVYEQCEPGRIGRDGKEIGERRRRRADLTSADESRVDDSVGGHADDSAGGDADAGTDGHTADTYYLPPGGYVVGYAETVAIPEDHVGFIYPRSSLLRNSCMLDTAVWDAGYEGKGEGLLEVYHGIELERGARIAQLVLADADHDSTYDGSYQHENL